MAGKGGNHFNMLQHKRDIMDAMYNDVIHGKQKYQIREKFLNGEYNNQALTNVSFCNYWNEMIEKFAEEFEKNREDLKAKFLSRYLYLYETNVSNGKIKEAKDVLDSIVKLTGADEPIRQEIDINGGFVIDFGLDDIVKDGKEDKAED